MSPLCYQLKSQLCRNHGNAGVTHSFTQSLDHNTVYGVFMDHLAKILVVQYKERGKVAGEFVHNELERMRGNLR